MPGFSFYRKQALVRVQGDVCRTVDELLDTSLFRHILDSFLLHLRETDSPFLKVFPRGFSDEKQDRKLLGLLKLLAEFPKHKILDSHPEYDDFFRDIHLLHQLVEELYNFWRGFERFLVCHSGVERSNSFHQKPYRTFNYTIETLNHLVRKAYRDICENITDNHPRIYRQVPAGFQVGLIVAKKDMSWLPRMYSKLADVPLIRQVLIEPPLILDPPMNKRTGQFRKVDSNPLEYLQLDEKDWLCYPAKVGDLVIYTFFHNKFIGLGTALANLFDLADDEDLERKPDAVFAYGVPQDFLYKFGELPTVFYEDEVNDLFVGVVPGDEEFGYFGYLKKMMLTLHNVIVMKKGRLPVHGAMARVLLNNGASANVVLLGDTGTGKSELLEAFRILGDKHIRDMKIVFDDMGSLELKEDGDVVAYGTETGAFVRLDDLQPGFAFGNIDRSIIMSPQNTNARSVIPITTLKDVLYGYHVDMLLYANNYERVDDEHPLFECFGSVDSALSVFRQGSRVAKGTTTETGLVSSYFANIFGPVQYKEIHDGLAEKYFKALFNSGCKVGQLRTRLGIKGYEREGPKKAAEALFEVISAGRKGI